MSETPAQYTARILGNVGSSDPLAVQAATPRKLKQLVSGLSAAQLRKQPGPGRWSIAEIVAHLADAELVGAYRLRKILETDGVDIQAYDQDLWAANGDYRAQKPADSLAMFTAIRVSNLRLYKKASPSQRRQFGMHAERGKETVDRIAQMFAGHDINHLQQIEALRRAIKAKK